jgi:hypothetical protein
MSDNLTDDQVIRSMLNYYKARGINLSSVLDEPLFKGLSTKTKVELLKKYAGEIESGTQSGIFKSDITKILWDVLPASVYGGIAGFGGGVAASKMFKGGKVHPLSVALAATLGASMGALASGINSAQPIGFRAQLKNQFQNLASHPTDENALQTLMLRNDQVNAYAAGAADRKFYVDNILKSINTSSARLGNQSTHLYNSLHGFEPVTD